MTEIQHCLKNGGLWSNRRRNSK